MTQVERDGAVNLFQREGREVCGDGFGHPSFPVSADEGIEGDAAPSACCHMSGKWKARREEVVPPARLERATPTLGMSYSIQLSYGGTVRRW